MNRLLILGAAIALAGCASDRNHNQSRAQPEGVRPIKLIPAIDGAFIDTDGNKYRDSARLFLYIMGDSPRYQLPIRTTGTLSCRLEDVRGKLIAEWNLDAKAFLKAEHSLPPGPGYVVDLDLRASSAGTDRIERSEAELVVRMQPADGESLTARAGAPVLIGPISKAPAK